MRDLRPVTTRNRWAIPAVIVLGLLVAVVAGGRLACGRAPSERPAGADAGAGAGCGATVDCPPKHHCMAPGKCGRDCTGDGECPPGQRCAELKLMDPQEEGSGAGTVTTCVIATPPP
jgi:hypothetical protein